jgi:oxygen-independent coproporphyrinogen-3 oxidase
MNKGIYIHIPFCIKKCNYCDFNSYDNMAHWHKQYTSALLKEIKQKSVYDYDTVFIGGGTPTCIPLPQLLGIVNCVSKENCEFTVEVNPATCDMQGFKLLYRAGVNRISFGLQSVHDNELETLGRIHTWSDFLTSYLNARDAGFKNINVDLMFSLPSQTVHSFYQSLKAVAALKPEHISCYCLSVEPGTPFYSMKLDLPSEEQQRQMYHLCVNYLKSIGYHHYEISNFAKSGLECKHNLKYWERLPYIGFGAGAHSFENNIRCENSRNIPEYISCNKKQITYLSESDIENEYIFLGLRKTDGICLADYKNNFGADFLEKYKHIIQKYNNFCDVSDGRFYLNLEGLTVSNIILADFME